MISISHIILSLILLSIIFALNSSRLKILVGIMFFQGVLLSSLPLFSSEAFSVESVFFAIFTLSVKGFLIPYILFLTLEKVVQKKEMEPTIGYNHSMLIGLFIIIISVFLSKKIHFPLDAPLLTVTAFSVIFTGMFLLIARRKTITQIIGYLMMENGIYLTGLALMHKSRHLMEIGVLLDVLVGVMLMVFVLMKINSIFKDINTKNLKKLRD